MVNNVPNGVWEDSDAGIMYPDLQDFEDYQRNGNETEFKLNIFNKLHSFSCLWSKSSEILRKFTKFIKLTILFGTDCITR